MNEESHYSRLLRVATVCMLPLLLFYFPAFLFVMEGNEGLATRLWIGVIMATIYTVGFFIIFFRHLTWVRERKNLQKRVIELEAEREFVELQSLEAQLNPHFLFNSINNIYALIGTAPDKAREALHDLSGMFRFMIYESSNGPVPLERGERFIKEYVELMRLRMGGCELEYDYSDNFPKQLWVAPLLMLTLVENAFKHGGSNGTSFFIHISLYYNDHGEWNGKRNIGELVFNVENTFSSSEKVEEAESSSGVGLRNVMRQLDLLYGDAYRFDVDNAHGIYKARIIIRADVLTRNEREFNE